MMSADRGDDYGLAVRLLLQHKAEHARTFLEENGISKSGTRNQLEARLLEALDDSSITLSGLLERIDEVESWGKQHLYFYGLPSPRPQIAKIRLGVEKGKHANLITAPPTLLLPSALTRARITFSSKAFRLIWVDARHRTERVEENDFVEDGIEYRAHRVHHSRAVSWLEVDLAQELITLSVGQLERQGEYPAHRDRLLSDAHDFLGVKPGAMINIAQSIKKLQDEAKVDTRGIKLNTPRNTQVHIRSADRKRGYRDDPRARKAAEALGPSSAREANFYWNLNGQRIHAKIYQKDGRLGVFTDCRQPEVENVIISVLRHC